MPTKRKHKGPEGLLGIGLDNQDGHKRITQAGNMAVVGGSSETHERLTETIIKTQEELSRRGKHLRECGDRELAEILHKASGE
jgi:hypothetical protein